MKNNYLNTVGLSLALGIMVPVWFMYQMMLMVPDKVNVVAWATAMGVVLVLCVVAPALVACYPRKPLLRAAWHTILYRLIINDWWRPIPCTWPHPPGWATYNHHRGTVLDTGLDRTAAQTICDALNHKP